MQRVILDAEAGEISREPERRGIASDTRVHVTGEVPDALPMPMAAIAETGKAFEWLAEEPDLYSDADLAGGR